MTRQRRRARPDIRSWTVWHEVSSQTVTSAPLAGLYPRKYRGPVGWVRRHIGW